MCDYVCMCVTIIIIEEIMNSRGTWGDMRHLGEGRERGKSYINEIYPYMKFSKFLI